MEDFAGVDKEMVEEEDDDLFGTIGLDDLSTGEEETMEEFLGYEYEDEMTEMSDKEEEEEEKEEKSPTLVLKVGPKPKKDARTVTKEESMMSLTSLPVKRSCVVVKLKNKFNFFDRFTQTRKIVSKVRPDSIKCSY